MRSIIVFNYLNDIIYTKYNQEFAKHINEHARSLGLLPRTDDKDFDSNIILNNNVLMQIFSPLITSQRIMNCQLGNSYTSIKCERGLNITFEEYMDFLFMVVSNKDDPKVMKKYISVSVALVRFLCGPDVLLLRKNSDVSETLTKLIDTWWILYNNNQAILVEAIEQLIVNTDLSAGVVTSLKGTTENLLSNPETSKYHAMVLVQSKFLALYSSRNAKELSATDILFLTILCESIKISNRSSDESETDKTATNGSNGIVNNGSADKENEIAAAAVEEAAAVANTNLETDQTLSSFQVLFNGTDFISKCIPHTVHIKPLSKGVDLVLVIETGNQNVSSCMYNTFYTLTTIQNVQLQRDSQTLRPCFESLDISFKKLLEALKKTKISNTEGNYKALTKKWESIRKKYTEFLKTENGDCLLQVEANTSGMRDLLLELLHSTSYDPEFLEYSAKHADECAISLCEKLNTFKDFMNVTSIKNYTLSGKDYLSINKYLEEFPGLVHFFYIDRNTHRVTMPTLDFSSEETNTLTKTKIWDMLAFARNHIQDGRLSVMWKDTTFCYAYFLWFEDNSGGPMKANIYPTNANKPLPLPGIVCGDFYQILKEVCFPKMISSKIRCYELLCIHLGLVTAPCVLEQTRRLAATVYELRGQPNHPVDLF